MTLPACCPSTLRMPFPDLRRDCVLEPSAKVEIKGLIAAFRMSVSEVKRPNRSVDAHEDASGENQVARIDVIESVPDSAGFHRASHVNGIYDACIETQDAAIKNEAPHCRILIGESFKRKSREIQKTAHGKGFV